MDWNETETEVVYCDYIPLVFVMNTLHTAFFGTMDTCIHAKSDKQYRD